MALQRKGFNVPLVYEFLPLRAQWFLCTAELVGWSAVLDQRERDSERAESLNLSHFLGISQRVLNANASTSSPPRMGLLGGDWVTLSIRRRSPGIIGKLLPDLFDGPIQIRRSELSTEILPDDCTPENTPELCVPHFQVLVSVPSPQQTNSLRSNPPDARHMRNEFLELSEGDNASLAEFLTAWGIWGGGINWIPWKSGTLGSLEPKLPRELINPETIWHLREIYRRAMTGNAKTWFARDQSTPVARLSGSLAAQATLPSLFGLSLIRTTYPHFVVQQNCCRQAIEDMITIDKLREIKHQVCKRKACNRVYEVTSKHARGFCSKACATAVRVKRFRKAKGKRGGSTHAAR